MIKAKQTLLVLGTIQNFYMQHILFILCLSQGGIALGVNLFSFPRLPLDPFIHLSTTPGVAMRVSSVVVMDNVFLVGTNVTESLTVLIKLTRNSVVSYVI